MRISSYSWAAGALTSPGDQERLKFFTDLTKKVNKPSSQDAYVYSLVALADIKLKLREFDDARKDLDTTETILDTFDSVETEVHAAFYRTNARYYQVSSRHLFVAHPSYCKLTSPVG